MVCNVKMYSSGTRTEHKSILKSRVAKPVKEGGAIPDYILQILCTSSSKFLESKNFGNQVSEIKGRATRKEYI